MNSKLKAGNDCCIAVIGLGYVGLPLAVEFAKKREVIGFDINEKRIRQLNGDLDKTLEVSEQELKNATGLRFTFNPEDLVAASIYIITVPTPIDAHNRPELSPLRNASEIVGRVLSEGDIVIYESTVFPGATEEECVPILEKTSKLHLNNSFVVGYSPERINPGDKTRRLTDIKKVTSGSTAEAARTIDELYKTIIPAGTYSASSIRVAEAAKVIENTQRDVNIALINELAIIFNRLGIDTEEVLNAAGTKWNFLPFRPGLVGGHCIGVDPYYLTYKAEEIGYKPEIILSGRRLNDGMGKYVANSLIKEMMRRGILNREMRVLILGLTFKENCPDLRNTRVIDVVCELKEYGVNVDVYDPWVDPVEAKSEYDLDIITEPKSGTYDGIILAVAHSHFRELGAKGLHAFGRDPHLLYDLKHLLPAEVTDMRL